MNRIGIKNMVYNLAVNWYFPIGAVFFYYSAIQWYGQPFALPVGWETAFVICTIFAAVMPPMMERIHRMRWPVKAFSAMTATGIFWDPLVVPLGGVSFEKEIERISDLFSGLPFPALAAELAIAGAWIFAFVCVAMLFEKLLQIIGDTGMLQGIPIWEWTTYAVLLMGSALLITVVFSGTGAFYGNVGDKTGAVIYSSDSYLIVPQSAYVNLFHDENDIRQPLFAVFAAPFTGFAYFLGAFVFRWPTAQMLLLDFTQLCLIFFGGFLLAQMLELSPVKRVCFMLLFCCSYMYILFILMMEQYAVAFFWLLFCVYLIWKGQPEMLAVLGAGGTLITSLVMVPLAQGKDLRKDFRGWFYGCIKHGTAYVAAILGFCRMDVILGLTKRAELLTGFTGKNVSFCDRIMQYLAFVRNCFLAPSAYIDLQGEGGAAWWQVPVEAVDAVGVLLLLCVLISFWLNRKNRGSLLCGYWVAFSAVVLAVIGWGTEENGLMLYGLYFGWAYFVLLYQLGQWVSQKAGKPWLLWVFVLAAAGMMLAVNIPEVCAMVDFAATYYPG